MAAAKSFPGPVRDANEQTLDRGPSLRVPCYLTLSSAPSRLIDYKWLTMHGIYTPLKMSSRRAAPSRWQGRWQLKLAAVSLGLPSDCHSPAAWIGCHRAVVALSPPDFLMMSGPSGTLKTKCRRAVVGLSPLHSWPLFRFAHFRTAAVQSKTQPGSTQRL